MMNLQLLFLHRLSWQGNRNSRHAVIIGTHSGKLHESPQTSSFTPHPFCEQEFYPQHFLAKKRNNCQNQ